MHEFLHFYSDLYSSRTPASVLQDDYLDEVTLARLTASDHLFLAEPCSNDEIQAVIGGLKASKAPGSDGLPPDFYKAFRNLLGPVLLKMYEESRESGSFLHPCVKPLSFLY